MNTEATAVPLSGVESSSAELNDRTDTLKQKVVRGSVWLLVLQLTVRSIGLVSTMVLARLLSPSDFGVLGIAVLSMALLDTFSQTGFEGALIQKKGNVSHFLDTAWFVSVARGLFLALVLYAIAPAVAAFFDSPKSGDILKILALCPMIKGMNSVGIVFFRKELVFKKVFFYELSGHLVYVLVAVPLAFLLKNVWALVFGMLANHFVTLGVSYLIHPYRPRLKFNWKDAGELFSFGKWLLGTQIVLYFINQGDNLFVGKLLGPAALGLYAMAYKISFLAVTEITHVISKVMFPAYSKLQSDREKLREAYVKMLRILGFFSFPATMMIFVFAGDAVTMMLGEKWLPIIPIVQIFSVSALFRTVSATTGPLFQGLGKPEIITKLVSARLVIIACSIYPLTLHMGMEGTALAILASAAVIDPVAIAMGARMTGIELKELFHAVSLPLANSLILGSLVLMLKAYVLSECRLQNMMALMVLSMAGYLFMAYLQERLFKYDGLLILRNIVVELGLGKTK